MAIRWQPSIWPTSHTRPRRHWFWRRSTTPARRTIFRQSLPRTPIDVGMPRRFPDWPAIGDAAARRQLLQILADERDPLAADAAGAAGLAADPDLLPPLAALVRSRNKQIALASLLALRRFLSGAGSLPQGLAIVDLNSFDLNAVDRNYADQRDVDLDAAEPNDAGVDGGKLLMPAADVPAETCAVIATAVASLAVDTYVEIDVRVSGVGRCPAVAWRAIRRIVVARGRPGRVGTDAVAGDRAGRTAPIAGLCQATLNVPSNSVAITCHTGPTAAKGKAQDAMNPLQLAAFELRLQDLKSLVRDHADLSGTLLAASSAHDPDPAIQVSVIRYLIRRGVAVDEIDKNGVAPLHRAVRFRSFAAVKELIAQAADVNVVDKKSRSTPLHRAVTNTGAPATAGKMDCAIRIAKLLLTSGGDPRIKNKSGKTPVDYAKHPKMKDVLLQHDAT